MSQVLAEPIALTPVEFDPFAGGELSLVVPATEPQREIWLSVQMGEGASCAFNESVSIDIAGHLNPTALQTAVNALIARYETLRATFSSDGLLLCIAQSLYLPLGQRDLRPLSSDQQTTELAKLRHAEVTTPFNLTVGPLLRLTLVQLGPRDVLLLTFHHIIADGWSIAVLLNELTKLYSAAVNGTQADLPPAYPFSQYSQWLEGQRHTADWRKTERYWLDQFPANRDIPTIDLPTDRPHPQLRTYAADREDYPLSPTLVAGLKKVGAKAGCTLFTALFGAFAGYLSRILSQEDVVIGVPAAGQSPIGQPNLIGHCVYMLPIRAQVPARQNFTDLLKSLRGVVLSAYDHQQYTFGTLINQLPIPRDPSRIPLVPVTFNIDQENRALTFGGATAVYRSNPRRFENFEMAINALEQSGGLVIECQYNTDLFDRDTIRRRLGEFEVWLEGLVADPQRPLAYGPLLSPAAEEQLLRTWNATAIAYPFITLHELIESQVERTPNAIAAEFEGQRLTYRDLNGRANQLARYLRGLGVSAGTLVGIHIDPGLDMLVGLLGILKAGGAYVPLDPAFPKERLTFMVEDAKLKIIVTQASLLAFAQQASKTVALDSNWPAISKESAENLVSRSRPRNRAYVLYTSGSTGKPKGVQIPHRALVNFLTTMRQAPGLTEKDALLAVTTLSFDIAGLELYLPLITGAKVILVRRETAVDGSLLMEAMAKTKPTVMQATPSTWRILLEMGWQGDKALKILCGGEAFPRQLVDQLLERCGELWNMYGPTETAIWSAIYQLKAGESRVPIGRPIGNTQLYVLDKHLQPVPVGVPGELYIAGDGLALSYLRRSALTAEKFVPCPFHPPLIANALPGPRMYRTGDLVRLLPDGCLEFLARVDFQVKVRGFRIELGEIESALNSATAVAQSVVIVREDTPGDKRIVAYYVPAGPEPSPNDLRQHLRSLLPEYMMPALFVALPQFPLTPNGKIDRKALPSPDQSRRNHEVHQPGTLIEEMLARIWAEALSMKAYNFGPSEIDIDDNFFELGGHSLAAARFIARAKVVFQVDLQLHDLFEHPTIAGIAKRIEAVRLKALDEQVHAQPWAALVPIQSSGEKRPFFLVPGGPGTDYQLMFYAKMVYLLGQEQPVYGIRMNMGKIPREELTGLTVEKIASYYIQELRDIQPEGPYIVGGECIGGILAYEIAQQLRAQNEKVTLILMNTTRPTRWTYLSHLTFFDRVVTHFEELPVLDPKDRLPYVWQKTGVAVRKLFGKFRINTSRFKRQEKPAPDATENVILPDHAEPAYIENPDRVHRMLLIGYRPQPYPGKIMLLLSEDNYKANRTMGWQNLAVQGLEIFKLPGNHFSYIGTYVQTTAKQLKSCLDAAQEG